MKTKGKLKKNIGRYGRMQLAKKETTETKTTDLSQLRKPIGTNLCSLKQVAALFENGSDEVKALLSYECDVVYECKICRSLFRSLANFISHKRVYCTKKFNITLDRNSIDPTNSICKGDSIVRSESESEYKENCKNDRILRSQTTKKDPKKDLTSIVEMLMKKQNDDFQNENNANEIACPLRISSDNEQVLLEIMDSNQAAYQTIFGPEIAVSAETDLMKNQTLELKNILSRNTAILGPDGQLLKIDDLSKSQNNFDNIDNSRINIIPGSDAELTCTTCNASFATKKTLTFHVKSKHMPHQVNYRCPCCTSIFTNRASVHRHLIKVHRKTNEQMRRLRSQIQPMKLPNDEIPTKNSNDSEMVEDSQNLIIAQEWMENLELDGEYQRCNGCGRRFDRKAALISHLQICPKKNSSTRNESTGRHKRVSKNPPQRLPIIDDTPLTNSPKNHSQRSMKIIENNSIIEKSIVDQTDNEISIERSSSPKIEIHDWQMSEPEPPSISISRLTEKNPDKSNLSLETPEEIHETSIRVEGVSSLSKDVWDKIGVDQFIDNSEQIDKSSSPQKKLLRSLRPNKTILAKTTEKSISAGTSDVPEVIYTSIDNSKPVTLSVINTEKKLGIQYRGIRLPTVTLEKIDIPRQTNTVEPIVSLNMQEEDRGAPIDKKFISLTNIRKLQCLPCNRKFMSLVNLRRHVASHLKRNRYRCKICDFKAFLKCECVAHCNKKHNAKNDRGILADMVVEIPLSNDTIESNKITKITNDESIAKDELEVIDVTSIASTSKEKIDNPTIENEKIENHEEMKKIILTKKENLCKDTKSYYPKPKRGRPPKRRRKTKGKRIQRARHVSPPTLAGDFTSVDVSVDIAESNESPEEQNLIDNKVSKIRAPSRMDNDPELRKMVMEVIFGTTDKEINEETQKDNHEEIDVVCERIIDTDENQLSNIAVNNNSQIETIVHKQKIDDMTIEISSINDTNTSDFHYDLQAVAFPKNVVLLRNQIAVDTKTLNNRSIVKLQNHDSHCDNNFSSNDKQLIIYDNDNVKSKLTEIQQADIVICADK